MSIVNKLVLGGLALLALPFEARADLVLGVSVPGTFYRPHFHRWYGHYAVVAPPVVPPPPRTVYVGPPPATVYLPPPGTTYVAPVAPPPPPLYMPR
jgi:hypothetical protein